ncbi:MAG: hypothetical protein ACRYFZ_16010 [Janthinobacterium lividum]
MLLTLPVKPYTLKFLTRHLGAGYKLGNSDIFGRFLYGLLRSPRTDRQYEDYLDRYTAEFPVRIVPYLVADRACKNCSPLTIVHFNGFVEEIFYKEFHDFVLFRVEEDHMEAKVAIEKFCKRFALTEDDVAYETLKKNWQRFFKKEKKRRQTPDSPSGLSLAA